VTDAPPAATAGLRAQVRAFLLGQGIQPHCDAWMSSFDPAFSRALGQRGWIGMTWPARYGGAHRPAGERLAVIEELLAAGAPVAAHWFADRQVGPALLRIGSERQRARYLPAITRGECYFAIGMSEPDSGSDLASIRTAGPGHRIRLARHRPQGVDQPCQPGASPAGAGPHGAE
jgi:acyl-CoA dehydrogenase